jgi:calreticulin
MFLFFLIITVSATDYFIEPFDDIDRWINSSTREEPEKMGTFELTDDNQLKTSQDARFYTMWAPLDTVVDQEDKDFVIQYSIQLENTDFKCGGSYLKLLSYDGDLSEINHETPYQLMFGPDHNCNSKSKVHAIFGDKPWSNSVSADVLSDGAEHFFSLVIRPNNSYSYFVDGEEVESGDIEEVWALLEPKKIKDPSVSKPNDWPIAEILDESHVKPKGYDDILETIVDFEAFQPDDWDNEEDGAWEPPNIPNPEYEGPWHQRYIPNPEYEGEWIHPMIPNPEYVSNSSIYKQVQGANVIGFEIWNFDSGVLFDNIIVSDDSSKVEAEITEM